MELKTLTNLGRLKDIAVVLVKYGFGDLLQRLDLPIKDWVHDIAPKIDTEADVFERIRLAIEELGPTFVKVGQILSMRPDILPVPLIRELSKLQDAVGPIPFKQVKEVLEKEFDTSLESLFSSFDPEPVAAASLSQVHKAVHRSEARVLAVKVRRPGIAKVVKNDLNILETLAQKCHDNIDTLRMYDLPGIVESSRRTLLREIDFSREARYIQIAKSKIEQESDIVIPEVFTEYSTPKVLVIAFISGTKITPDLEFPQDQRKRLAGIGLRSAILQILDHGFFHADPHPGNMVITRDHRLCLMDWGMVGRLTVDEKNELLFLIRAAVDKDSRKLTETLLNIAIAQKPINARQLEKDVMDIMDVYMSLSLKEIQVGRLLEDLVQILKTHELRLPPDMSIVVKAVITVEGTARMLYPDLDVISASRPHVRKLVAQRYSKQYLWQRLRHNLSSMWGLQKHLPATLSAIFKKNGTWGFHHQV
ncbi:MAG: AarF/UbiB family protein [Desulfotignum sp.]